MITKYNNFPTINLLGYKVGLKVVTKLHLGSLCRFSGEAVLRINLVSIFLLDNYTMLHNLYKFTMFHGNFGYLVIEYTLRDTG